LQGLDQNSENYILKRFLKILRNIGLSILALIILIIILVNFSPVQTFIAKRATIILSDKLKTKVSIDKVKIGILNSVTLEGLYVEGRDKDTLLYTGELSARITDWFIFSDKPVIKYVGLKNTYANLYRTSTSDQWNFQFIIDAFDSGKKSTSPKKKSDFDIGLEKVELENVRFHMDDAWIGADKDFEVGSFVIDANKVDFKNKILDIDKIVAKRTAVMIRDYDGGRPPRAKKPSIVDTTPFNKGNWVVKLGRLSLEDCIFSSDQDEDAPTPNMFDPQHIGVKEINAEARDIKIVGDTVRGKMTFSAKERSGFIVKKLKADVFVSPNASICDNLYLETNNSILERYYAMYYTRFPDFKNYIDKVVMVGDFKNARIDANDVGYFAPSVRQFKTIVKANGFVAGTVDSLTSKNLNVTDGNMIVKGDLRMIGLPDINNTWIDYKNGEIYTNGQAIFHYAPSLKDNPNLALEKVTNAYFKGNYVGYIDNFIANGTLVTNLGSITSDVKMNIPDMNQSKAVYSGTVKSDNFDLGTLLRIKDLGAVTMSAKVQGNAFDPEIAKINVDAFIDHITYRGYAYQKIKADGVVERNKFDGNLLIDDPNLAFAFYGQLKVEDKQLKINATANLLKSDFKALNLTKDSLTATADIDLNWVGTNFDNFLGYVKLYNINVLRFGNRLDLDSIYVQSTMSADSQKLVTVESNALSATLSGNYQITKLPNSVIFYLSKYLPNYIKAPTSYAPDQDLTFAVTTRRVDNLLGVLVPSIKGFNNSTINGSLNTNEQSLNLNAKIPYGAVGNVSMHNVSVSGDGDFRLLGLNAEAERIVLGDSILKGSVSVTTTLGNDSMIFNIATNSREALGTATINGRAYAQNDSLYFNLMASEFYLGGTKWEISDGSTITLADKYLYTQNINIHSGSQEIDINSASAAPDAPIGIEIKNLDVGQITVATKLSETQTYGTINGNIKIENLFKKLFVTANIKASDVIYGPDTLGNIIVDGSYDAEKNTVNLDPQSGMYRGSSSMTVGGTLVLFDSTSKQRVNGTIQFNNSPLNWLSPVVTGYVSKLSGNLQGTVHIKGAANSPDVDGKVLMDNAHVKVDFLGTEYDMSPATINLNNQEINFGNITLQDIFKNKAILAGKITHDRFKDLELNFNVGSSKFQVINLEENENETFYGNLIVGFRNLSVRGPVDDIRIRISSARPADKSHLFIPIGGTSISTNYNYVSFKPTAADSQNVVKRKGKNKLYINIDAVLNELAEITLVLDPSTGDAINATGTGNLNMEIPLGNDIRMYGVYEIAQGDYTFTLKQLFFKRKFDLNAGSRINFNGLISQTEMNVQGVYTTRTRLYDLLNAQERTVIEYDRKEARETKAPQNVNVLLYMNGSLEEPKLSFKLDLPDKRAAGTLAYAKLESYNQDPKLLFNQVAGLLLIGSFIPENGTGGDNTGSATAGAISNISEILSGTASSQLTNVISKITGDQTLSFDLKYKAYNYYNTNSSGGGQDNLRNELTFGFTKNYFNDRLNIELGSAYDWGRPTSASNKTSNFNPVGDFRIQYQFREGGNVRGYIFRTSTYDVIGESNLTRGGVGVSWRKSFDSFEEFFHGERYARKKLEEEQKKLSQPADTSTQRTGGTW
jgi:hypothetical protein